jgi:hypothetical protein
MSRIFYKSISTTTYTYKLALDPDKIMPPTRNQCTTPRHIEFTHFRTMTTRKCCVRKHRPAMGPLNTTQHIRQTRSRPPHQKPRAYTTPQPEPKRPLRHTQRILRAAHKPHSSSGTRVSSSHPIRSIASPTKKPQSRTREEKGSRAIETRHAAWKSLIQGDLGFAHGLAEVQRVLLSEAVPTLAKAP